MFKMMILFRQSADPDFEEHYNKSLALLEQIPGIHRKQASIVVGSPEGVAPFARVLELYFADRETMQEGLLSAQGQAAGQNLMAFAQYDSVVLYAEVYEE